MRVNLLAITDKLGEPQPRPPAPAIQKLRNRPQVLPVGAGPPALPVGGGPRNPDWFREDFLALLELLCADKIHPVIADRLPLSDARRAHELLERSAAVGGWFSCHSHLPVR
jgi:NADPH:quinone reductase-like Zn-dependent oxidoreductase